MNIPETVSSLSSSIDETENDCLICEKGLTEPEKCPRCRPCAHIFMSQCLLEWFSKNKRGRCPVCELFTAKGQKDATDRQLIEEAVSRVSQLEVKLNKGEDTVQRAEKCVLSLKEIAENYLQRALTAEKQLELTEKNAQDDKEKVKDQVRELMGKLDNMEGMVKTAAGDGQELHKRFEQVVERLESAEKRAKGAEQMVQDAFEEILKENETTEKYVQEYNKLFDKHLEELKEQDQRNRQEAISLTKIQDQEYEKQTLRQLKESEKFTFLEKKPEEMKQLEKRQLEVLRKISERHFQKTEELIKKQTEKYVKLNEKQVKEMKNLLKRQMEDAKAKDIGNGLLDKLMYLSELKIRECEEQAARKVGEFEKKAVDVVRTAKVSEGCKLLFRVVTVDECKK